MEIFGNKVFDYAIFGGSVKGVLTAAYLAKKNYSVLLINKYGFLGGAITENLVLLQNIDYIDLAEFNDIFFKSNAPEKKIINPEKLKFALQDILVSHNIQPLFHVSPVSIIKNKINLIGKDGMLTVYADKIFDCSDNLYLEYLHGNIFYNKGIYFLTLKEECTPTDLNKILSPIFVHQISNGRYFCAYEINFDDILQVEINSHELVNNLTKLLTEKNYRIELLPLSTYLIPTVKSNSFLFNPLQEINISHHSNILQESINFINKLQKII